MALTSIKLNQIKPEGAISGNVIKFSGSNWIADSLLSTNISDFSEAVDDRVSNFVIAGSGISIVYDDPSNTLTFTSTGNTTPAGTNYNVQFYDNGHLGADSKITVTPGSSPKLAVGTTSPAATLHTRGNNTLGSLNFLSENSNLDDILSISNDGFVKFGNNESLPHIFQTNAMGSGVTYSGLGLTIEGQTDENLGLDILSVKNISTLGASIANGDFSILNIGGFYDTDDAAPFSSIKISSNIGSTGTGSPNVYGLKISPSIHPSYNGQYYSVFSNIDDNSFYNLYQSGTTGVSKLEGSLIVGDTDTNTPCARLVISGTDRGLLNARLEQSQRDAIDTPLDGLQIYNSDSGKMNFRQDGEWVEYITSSGITGGIQMEINSNQVDLGKTFDSNFATLTIYDEINSTTARLIQLGNDTDQNISNINLSDTFKIQSFNSLATMNNWDFNADELTSGDGYYSILESNNREFSVINSHWMNSTGRNYNTTFQVSNNSSLANINSSTIAAQNGGEEYIGFSNLQSQYDGSNNNTYSSFGNTITSENLITNSFFIRKERIPLDTDIIMLYQNAINTAPEYNALIYIGYSEDPNLSIPSRRSMGFSTSTTDTTPVPFNWLKIDIEDSNITGHNITLYHDSYAFPNAIPSSGGTDESIMIWTANGSGSTTPSFILLDSIVASGGTNGIYGGSDIIPSGTFAQLLGEDDVFILGYSSGYPTLSTGTTKALTYGTTGVSLLGHKLIASDQYKASVIVNDGTITFSNITPSGNGVVQISNGFIDISAVNYQFVSGGATLYSNFSSTSGGLGLVLTDAFTNTGSATNASITINGAFIQTGGGTGITRGLHINPTLTNIADYRAIEISNNDSNSFSIYQSGANTKNYFNGNVGIKIAAPAQALDVNGIVRIRSVVGITPTGLIGRDANGDVGAIVLGSGLTLAGGTLTASGGSGGITLYTGNGTAADGRTVTLGGNITFDGSAASNGKIFKVDMGSQEFSVTKNGTISLSNSPFFASLNSSSGFYIESSTDGATALLGLESGDANMYFFIDNGKPEGVTTANIGSICFVQDNSVGKAFIKASGSTSTGWREFGTGPDIFLSNLITGTGSTELFINGSGGSIRAVISSTNAVWMANISLTAVCINPGNSGTLSVGDSMGAKYFATIRKIGSTTSLVGDPQLVSTLNLTDNVPDYAFVGNTQMQSAVLTITADDTNDSLKLSFTPPTSAGSTSKFNVVAKVEIIETTW